MNNQTKALLIKIAQMRVSESAKAFDEMKRLEGAFLRAKSDYENAKKREENAERVFKDFYLEGKGEFEDTLDM